MRVTNRPNIDQRSRDRIEDLGLIHHDHTDIAMRNRGLALAGCATAFVARPRNADGEDGDR